MNVIFRVDASVFMGTGHVMRCLTLADELRRRDAQVTFVCREHTGNMAEKIKSEGYNLLMLPLDRSALVATSAEENVPLAYANWLGASWQHDVEQTVSALRQIQADKPIDWIIVDHYAIDAMWEQQLAEAIGAKVMVIDDLANRNHYCDLLLDQNYSSEPENRYYNKVCEKTQLLLGPEYVLLRQEFEAAKKRVPRRNDSHPVRRINILFGGDDKYGYTIKVINLCEKIFGQSVHVDVVVGESNIWKNEITTLCKEKPAFFVHYACDSVANLFSLADLAIGSGGGATYERLFMNLQSILKPIADNQVEPLKAMQNDGLIDLFVSMDDLRQKLELVNKQGVTAQPDSVGFGTKYIVQLMLNETVSINKPEALDVRRTYNWMQSTELRSGFLVREAPHRKGHFIYWRNLLVDKTQRVFSIKRGDSHVGNCGVKHIDLKEGKAEAWIYIGSPGERGKGVGRLAMRLLLDCICKKMDIKLIYLHVRMGHGQAIALYKALGFSEAVEDSDTKKPSFMADVLKMEKQL